MRFNAINFKSIAIFILIVHQVPVKCTIKLLHNVQDNQTASQT